jgi:hypothetical protein
VDAVLEEVSGARARVEREVVRVAHFGGQRVRARTRQVTEVRPPFGGSDQDAVVAEGVVRPAPTPPPRRTHTSAVPSGGDDSGRRGGTVVGSTPYAEQPTTTRPRTAPHTRDRLCLISRERLTIPRIESSGVVRR